MRIVFFGDINSCDPMKIGGSETYIRRLASILTSKGHTISIVMYGSDKDQEIEWNNLKLFYFRSFFKALKGIISQNADYIVENYIHKRYYFWYLFLKRQKINQNKFIIIFQIWPIGRIQRYLTIKIKTLFCSSVFAVSPRLVKELKNRGISAVWLPPFIPDNYFSSSSKKEGEIVLSYFGRISPDKGIDNLINTFEHISKSFPKSFLLKIYGYYDSSKKKSVFLYKKLKKMKIAECQIQPYKTYQYSLRGEELLADYLRETDVLIFPYKSLSGTLDIPLLILEGLAANCVIISTNLGDIPEIINKRGIIFKNNTELKEKLEELASSGIIRKYRSCPVNKKLFFKFSASSIAKDFILQL